MPDRLRAAGQRQGLGVKLSRRSAVPILAGLFVVLLGGSFVLLGRARARPNDAELRKEARTAASAHLWEQAESCLSRIDRLDPEDWLLRAVVAHERKDDDAAADYLARMPPDGPLASRAALARGQVERSRFHARAMETALRRALELDPGLLEARRLLVYLYGTQDRRDELIAQFARLLEDGPVTFELVRHSCLSHFESITDPESVKADLERFVASDSEDRASRIALANCHRWLGAFDTAIAVLGPVPDSDPDARAVRAETELDRGNLPTVAALLEGGPSGHARLALLRGRLAWTRGDFATASRFLNIADSARPNNRTTFYILGQALRRLGDTRAAEVAERRARQLQDVYEQIERVSDAKETRAQSACRLAACCEAARLRPEARALYRLAIAAEPLNAEAQSGLFRLPSRPPEPAEPGRSKSN